jgi:putative transposase
MSRPLRIEFPGAVYHVTARGNARNNIFLDDEDRENFLSLLASIVKRYNWLCHAYCLMDNHYHLMIETIDGNLSMGMRQLNGIYTQKYNRRHQRTGHILQGRFKALLVEKESYLLELCRYVVLNPVRASLVQAPEDWKWSSYKATAGFDQGPDFLTTDWTLALFNDKQKKAHGLYRSFVKEGIGQRSPWVELRGQILLGGENFFQRFKDLLEDKKKVKEITRPQRFVDRPGLDTVFNVFQTIGERDHAISRAHLNHGYTLKEIAVHLGLHYTTVSKVIGRKLAAKN